MTNQEFDPTNYPQPQPDLSDISPVEGYAAPFAQHYSGVPSWDPLTSQNYAWNTPVSPNSSAPDQPKRTRRLWPWVLMGFAAVGTVALIASGLVGSLFYFANESTDSGNSPRVGVGESNYAPTNDTLQDAYSSGVGEVNLDLSNLTPLDTAHSIDITSGIGEINVTLPETVPVELTCSTGIGTAHCDSGTYNADAEGEALRIEVSSGIGDVNVDFAQE